MGLLCPSGLVEAPEVSKFVGKGAKRAVWSGYTRPQCPLDDVQSHPAFHPSLPLLCRWLARCAAAGSKQAWQRSEGGSTTEPALALFEGPISASQGLEVVICRLVKYAICSPGVWPAAFALLHRFVERTGLLLTDANVQRIFLVAYTSAAKTLDDRGYDNAAYATIVTVGEGELFLMEAAFLTAIDWRTQLTRDEWRVFAVQDVPVICDTHAEPTDGDEP
eukprot:TRINITY_DN47587_c0_g1_i1.p1 TRINITY_DN47587_c0_g1~~TRINITY_DN47587_c0_g1_i1.p1  ORF type:complete len:220 (+),score=32.53 TRINITY_DN47587_c0_g1_i1:96-755(+)